MTSCEKRLPIQTLIKLMLGWSALPVCHHQDVFITKVLLRAHSSDPPAFGQRLFVLSLATCCYKQWVVFTRCQAAGNWEICQTLARTRQWGPNLPMSGKPLMVNGVNFLSCIFGEYQDYNVKRHNEKHHHYIYSEFIVWRSFRSSSQLQRASNTLAGSCLLKVKDIAKYLSNRWQKGNFEPFASSMKPAVYIYINLNIDHIRVYA